MQALVKIIVPGAGIAEKADLVEEIPDPIAETHMSIILEHAFYSQAVFAYTHKRCMEL
jgi:hypothetical protein